MYTGKYTNFKKDLSGISVGAGSKSNLIKDVSMFKATTGAKLVHRESELIPSKVGNC